MRVLMMTGIVLLTSACGSGGGATSEVRPAQIADKLGCSASYHDDSTQELGVRELGKCTVEGNEVSIYTFVSNAARDTYVQAASQFAGGRYEMVDRAVVTSNTPAAVDAAHSKLGGKLG